jgi:soluble lytic murein transglycosylase-like protein
VNLWRESVLAAASLVVLLAGLAALAEPTKPQPDAETLARFDAWQRAAAQRAKIDWLLAKAVRVKESFNDASYVSTTGAVGLMQLMPTSGGRMYVTRNYHLFKRARASPGGRALGRPSAHWARAYQRDLVRLRDSLPHDQLVRRDRRFDPRWNLERGTRHLAAEIERFVRLHPRASGEAQRRMALAAYYGGAGRVRYRRGEVLLPSYITPYVEDTLGVYRRLRAGLPGR